MKPPERRQLRRGRQRNECTGEGHPAWACACHCRRQRCPRSEPASSRRSRLGDKPGDRTLTARREAIAARRVTAQSWFAGAPYVTLGHVTDQVIVNKQQRATEGELAVPLWLPGEGTATEQVVDAELLRCDAQMAEAKLKVAGEVREALYAVALAEGEVKMADQRVGTARQLEADVARRERAGEVAALERRSRSAASSSMPRQRRASAGPELAASQVEPAGDNRLERSCGKPERAAGGSPRSRCASPPASGDAQHRGGDGGAAARYDCRPRQS